MADTPISVRDADPADADRIAGWNVAMAAETEDLQLDSDTVSAGVRAVMAEPARGFYLVAEVDNANAGGAMVTREWSDWRNGEFWWVQSVYVMPEFRRKGVYRALYNAIQQRAAAADEFVCGFRLYVEKENLRAQNTYEKLGMSRTHYQMFEQSGSPTRQ